MIDHPHPDCRTGGIEQIRLGLYTGVTCYELQGLPDEGRCQCAKWYKLYSNKSLYGYKPR